MKEEENWFDSKGIRDEGIFNSQGNQVNSGQYTSNLILLNMDKGIKHVKAWGNLAYNQQKG